MSMTRQEFDALVIRILDRLPNPSDIIITAGKPIQAEVDGALEDAIPEVTPEKLSPQRTAAMALALLDGDERLRKTLAARGSCDLSYALPGRGRFRVNVFSQRGSLAMVLRRLPTRIPTMEELGLPPAFREMTRENHGLILVTGPTGSGKSNSLAALVDAINRTRAEHIITLEDPVEFIHPHKKGTVNQRELGIDFDTFASGLRATFRQGPQVILLGEIRDPETMEIALQAADTGHLVLSTLHTADAGGAIGRILGLFSPSEERLVRMRLAECLRYVVSQRLLPKVGGGRIAAFEVMKNTLRIRELILQGETPERTFYDVLEAGSAFGMRTFDQDFFRLYEAGRIDENTALFAATDRARLGRMIDASKTRRGEAVSNLVLDGLDEPEK